MYLRNARARIVTLCLPQPKRELGVINCPRRVLRMQLLDRQRKRQRRPPQQRIRRLLLRATEALEEFSGGVVD